MYFLNALLANGFILLYYVSLAKASTEVYWRYKYSYMHIYSCSAKSTCARGFADRDKMADGLCIMTHRNSC